MKFCDECDNMLYTTVSKEEGLVYLCRNCGWKLHAKDTVEKSRVVDTNYQDDEVAYAQYARLEVVQDPTLPRVSFIHCPNAACTRAPDQPREVVYIKYDASKLGYLYHCTHCQQFWRSAPMEAVESRPV